MHLKAGEGIRTLDFHVGNMPWSGVWRYQKRGFALHIWSVLHYKTPVPAPVIESQPMPNSGSICSAIRRVQPAKIALQSWSTPTMEASVDNVPHADVRRGHTSEVVTRLF